jgi:hypothetical protein
MDSRALRAPPVVLDDRCASAGHELHRAELVNKVPPFMNCHTMSYIAAIENIRKDINPHPVFLFSSKVGHPTLDWLLGFVEVGKIESDQVCAFNMNQGLKPNVHRTPRQFDLGYDEKKKIKMYSM